ncbi:endonuclease domain-containing protein [Actinoplanes sp. NPDC048796]|uniref:endonuclease domain-containing protein n=1 Tax=Actinoplanes sp. NPDC048796 TaxID=3155640 RepID=UPI0033C3FE75
MSVHSDDDSSLDTGTRICSGKGGCGAAKQRGEFGRRASGLDSVCKECRRRETSAWRRANPDAVRRMNLWRLYRIRADEYDRMRAEQDFRCAACGTHETEIDTPMLGRPRADGHRTPAVPLQVDHCHASGAVRGLLCGRCNRIIGIARAAYHLPSKSRYLT